MLTSPLARSGVTRVMAGMNKQMNMPMLQAMLRDFELQNQRMEQTSDVMGDAIDDAFEQEGEQEESEELVNQVCTHDLGPPPRDLRRCRLLPGARRDWLHARRAAAQRAHWQRGGRAACGRTDSCGHASGRRPGRRPAVAA